MWMVINILSVLFYADISKTVSLFPELFFRFCNYRKNQDGVSEDRNLPYGQNTTAAAEHKL